MHDARPFGVSLPPSFARRGNTEGQGNFGGNFPPYMYVQNRVLSKIGSKPLLYELICFALRSMW